MREASACREIVSGEGEGRWQKAEPGQQIRDGFMMCLIFLYFSYIPIRYVYHPCMVYFSYIYHKNQQHVGKYMRTIHGWYGIDGPDPACKCS